MDFLRDDLGNGVEENSFVFNASVHCRRSRQCICNDEVDLTNFIEPHLQESRSVASVGGRQNLELEITLLGIKKREQLRIRQEDIYVTTFAMIDLQHHRGAATKRPIIDKDLL